MCTSSFLKCALGLSVSAAAFGAVLSSARADGSYVPYYYGGQNFYQAPASVAPRPAAALADAPVRVASPVSSIPLSSPSFQPVAVAPVAPAPAIVTEAPSFAAAPASSFLPVVSSASVAAVRATALPAAVPVALDGPREGLMFSSPLQPMSHVDAPHDNEGAPEPARLIEAPDMAMGTLSALEIGGAASYYGYHENEFRDYYLSNDPNGSVGTKLGISLAATKAFANHIFVGLEGRYDYGRTDYTESGTIRTGSPATGRMSNIGDQDWEARFLIGHDSIWHDRYALTPYTGVGYYNDASDAQGRTDGDWYAYRKANEYFYVPIGLRPQIRIDSDDRLTAEFEYDYLIQGQHTSWLGDDPTAPAGVHTMLYQQGDGLGLRAKLLWERPHWSFGPFVDYWNIGTSSERSCGPGTNCWSTSPRNISIQSGLLIKYRFLSLE